MHSRFDPGSTVTCRRRTSARSALGYPIVVLPEYCLACHLAGSPVVCSGENQPLCLLVPRNHLTEVPSFQQKRRQSTLLVRGNMVFLLRSSLHGEL